jgi:hypothetical protein
MEQLFYSTTGQRFRLPSGMEDLRGYPLYVLIAAWGLRQRQLLTTACVSRRFYITQSQARDALHYIRHEGRLRICSESVPVMDGMHLYCKGIRILSVDLSEGPVIGKRRPPDVTTARPLTSRMPRQTLEEERQRRLRQWMVSRRPGERVPPVLLLTESEREGEMV